jgi:hypothetical protein
MERRARGPLPAFGPLPDGQAVPAPRSVQEVMADPDAEFNPAAGESLVMIPPELGIIMH